MAALIRHGVAADCAPRESVSGDAFLVQPLAEGCLLAVVDGLGHGEAAAAAARVAIETLRQRAGEGLSELMLHCHQALRGTRGVVMSLALIDRKGTMAWQGVGNVEGMLIRCSGGGRKIERLLTRGGVLGFQLPPLRNVLLPIGPGDLLILATDGIHSDFASAPMFADPLLKGRDEQEIAERILRDYARMTDDALVLAARFKGIWDE